MPFEVIRRLIDREGESFQRIENRWRPQGLLMGSQVRALIKDLERRFDLLSEAESELALLDRRDLYIKYLRAMRIHLRTALFSWKADQLKFLQSVSHFYSDYGAVLRLLKFDLLRGHLERLTT